MPVKSEPKRRSTELRCVELADFLTVVDAFLVGFLVVFDVDLVVVAFVDFLGLVAWTGAGLLMR